jgi:GntR family transcriptional regulator/MocR family aminotransferase
VRGAQQAVDLAARALLRPGEKVWFEDPGYPVARRLFELAGAAIVPVPLDWDGMMIDVGVRRAPDARMVYVAPSHQFPLGHALSLDRRLGLLAWAARAEAWILEDDYDSEFRYPGHPIASLQGLDAGQRVIYIGTFSKTVFPALRLGYLVVPPELVDTIARVQADVDHLAPTLEQAALADFIEEGHFTRHLRRMRSAYRERQDALLSAAARELAGVMRVEPADAGMHAIGWLIPESVDDREISRRALVRGIEAPSLTSYCIKAKLPPALLLGFASVRPHSFAPALRTLRKILDR